MDIRIEYTDKQISPWGDMTLMKNLMKKSEMSMVIQSLKLPEPGSNRIRRSPVENRTILCWHL